LGGPYAISQGTLAANSNYTMSYAGANLTITPAPLTIQADDKSRAAGVANPPFTGTYSGFQFGETPTVLTGALAFNTSATIASAPGVYAVTPFGQTSGNYAITYVNGALTVGAGTPQPLAAPLSTFVNPVIQAVNLWVPDPYIVAYGTDESTLVAEGDTGLLPPTASGPATGANPGAHPGEQPSAGVQADWRCFRYGLFTNSRCR
jgi:hypothetical protein